MITVQNVFCMCIFFSINKVSPFQHVARKSEIELQPDHHDVKLEEIYSECFNFDQTTSMCELLDRVLTCVNKIRENEQCRRSWIRYSGDTHHYHPRYRIRLDKSDHHHHYPDYPEYDYDWRSAPDDDWGHLHYPRSRLYPGDKDRRISKEFLYKLSQDLTKHLHKAYPITKQSHSPHPSALPDYPMQKVSPSHEENPQTLQPNLKYIEPVPNAQPSVVTEHSVEPSGVKTTIHPYPNRSQVQEYPAVLPSLKPDDKTLPPVKQIFSAATTPAPLKPSLSTTQATFIESPAERQGDGDTDSQPKQYPNTGPSEVPSLKQIGVEDQPAPIIDSDTQTSLGEQHPTVKTIGKPDFSTKGPAIKHSALGKPDFSSKGLVIKHSGSSGYLRPTNVVISQHGSTLGKPEHRSLVVTGQPPVSEFTGSRDYRPPETLVPAVAQEQWHPQHETPGAHLRSVSWHGHEQPTTLIDPQVEVPAPHDYSHIVSPSEIPPNSGEEAYQAVPWEQRYKIPTPAPAVSSHEHWQTVVDHPQHETPEGHYGLVSWHEHRQPKTPLDPLVEVPAPPDYSHIVSSTEVNPDSVEEPYQTVSWEQQYKLPKPAPEIHASYPVNGKSLLTLLAHRGDKMKISTTGHNFRSDVYYPQQVEQSESQVHELPEKFDRSRKFTTFKSRLKDYPLQYSSVVVDPSYETIETRGLPITKLIKEKEIHPVQKTWTTWKDKVHQARQSIRRWALTPGTYSNNYHMHYQVPQGEISQQARWPFNGGLIMPDNVGIPIGRSIYSQPFSGVKLPLKTVTITIPPASQAKSPMIDAAQLSDIKLTISKEGRVLPQPTFRAKIKKGIGGVTVVIFKPHGEKFIKKDGELYNCTGVISEKTGQCEGSLLLFNKTRLEDNCLTDDYPRTNGYACLSHDTEPIYMTYFRDRIQCETNTTAAVYMDYTKVNQMCRNVATNAEYYYYTEGEVDHGFNCAGKHPTKCIHKQTLVLSDNSSIPLNY